MSFRSEFFYDRNKLDFFLSFGKRTRNQQKNDLFIAGKMYAQ